MGNMSWDRMRASAGITVLVLVLATGCTATKHGAPLTEAVRSQVRTVAVIPAAFQPRTDYTAAMKTVENPALGGSSEERSVNAPDERTSTIWRQVGEAAWSEGWNPSFGRGLAVGAIIHPVAGVATMFTTDVPIGLAQSRERNKTIEAEIGRSVAVGGMQTRFAELLAGTGRDRTGLSFRTIDGRGPSSPEDRPDHRTLGGEGVDLALEVAVNDIGFIAGNEEDPVVSVFVHAGVRAVRTADGAEQSNGVSVYVSRKHKLSTWLRDDARVMRYEIEKAQADIAAWNIEKLFLLHEGPGSGSISTCMLTTYHPEEPGLKFGSIGLSVPKIDSLEPVFRWEAFPRDVDRAAEPSGTPPAITDVSYDLQIWRTSGGYPDTLVYDRRGLPIEPAKVVKTENEWSDTGLTKTVTRTLFVAEHRLEKPLEPSMEYYWTVRARFKLNGQARVTRWASAGIPRPPSIPDPCRNDHISLMHYYRFQTP